MRTTLTTESELSEAWDACWKQVRFDFFKVEMLQNYNMPQESDIVEAYRAGDKQKVARLIRAMLEEDGSAREFRDRQIAAKRVHVIEFPLTEYIQLEIESYKVSEELGEEIYLIDIDAFKLVQPPITSDYLLFDEKTVMLHAFDATGAWIQSVLFDDPETVSTFVAHKNAILSKSLRLNDFMLAHRIAQ